MKFCTFMIQLRAHHLTSSRKIVPYITPPPPPTRTTQPLLELQANQLFNPMQSISPDLLNDTYDASDC